MTAAAPPLRRVLALETVSEGFRTPDAAWRLRYGELVRRAADHALVAPPPPPPDADLAEEHFRLFGPAPACPLELTFHLAENPFEQARMMAHMAGFYRAFGLEQEPGERPDNLSVAASFLGLLVLKEWIALRRGLEEAREVTAAATEDFARDFLAPGAAAFVGKLARVSSEPFYAALAELLRSEVYAVHTPLVAPASRWERRDEDAEEAEVTCGALKRLPS